MFGRSNSDSDEPVRGSILIGITTRFFIVFVLVEDIIIYGFATRKK